MPESLPVISLLLPTRGRPRLARRFFESVVEQTEDLDSVEVVLYVDEDDESSRDLGHPRLHVSRIIGPSDTMGAYNTACLERARGRILILVNDDIVIQTRGWEQAVLGLDRRYPDGVYLGYANDLFKRERLSTFPILSRKACEILVHPYPRAYRGALIDYHLFDIFKRLQKIGSDRICYLKDVVFEHLHHRTGKVPYDETYRQRSRFGDDAAFVALRAQRQTAARRLEAAIRGNAMPALPSDSSEEARESGLAATLNLYARAFLADTGLPLAWRTFLFVWCSGRYVVSRTASREGPP